jgi:DsbC/DsbD-like thiol-disulfide interchange protein
MVPLFLFCSFFVRVGRTCYHLTMRPFLCALVVAGQLSPGQEPGAAARADTSHLTLTTSANKSAVVPGAKLSLWVDVVPKPKMHVYTPEQTDYIPISITLEPDDAFNASPPVFPKGEKYLFAPLNETQIVLSKPFRIVQDITVSRAAAAGPTLTIKGTLRYQACDDKVCYVPQTVPLKWTFGLKP